MTIKNQNGKIVIETDIQDLKVLYQSINICRGKIFNDKFVNNIEELKEKEETTQEEITTREEIRVLQIYDILHSYIGGDSK